MQDILITKVTGEKERFDPRKLMLSLHKAGAGDSQANEIVAHIEGELVEGITTNDIYRHAFDLLGHSTKIIAARYSMKRAIAELGPNGFPFEKFVAEIFKRKGYEAVTDQVVAGHCVEHEVDVVAWKDDELIMVEAKFHNEAGIKSDLKVALYINSRYEDLKNETFEYGGKKRKLTKWYLFTNTKFTDHAVKYAECKKLALVGWNYPAKGNLEDLVNESKLHPLTSLLTLSLSDKKALLEKKFLLCRDITSDNLASAGVDKNRIPKILEEAHLICE